MTSSDLTAEGFVRPEVRAAQVAFWSALADSGSQWTGSQRVAIASQARAAFARRHDPPWMRSLADDTEDLPAAATAAARKIAADAAQIDREWASGIIEQLGDAAYVELTAVAACVVGLDVFGVALGMEPGPLPIPDPGSETRYERPNVVDAGAYVPLESPWSGPNVGRALSLAPADNGRFRALVDAMYAGGAGRGFMNLVWDGPLTRPQVELVAARVSALNECFY